MVLKKGKPERCGRLDAGLLAMSDLLSDEGGEEVVIGPPLSLGPLDEVAIAATGVGEV